MVKTMTHGQILDCYRRYLGGDSDDALERNAQQAEDEGRPLLAALIREIIAERSERRAEARLPQDAREEAPALV